jgi:hypothetical protein
MYVRVFIWMYSYMHPHVWQRQVFPLYLTVPGHSAQIYLPDAVVDHTTVVPFETYTPSTVDFSTVLGMTASSISPLGVWSPNSQLTHLLAPQRLHISTKLVEQFMILALDSVPWTE